MFAGTWRLSWWREFAGFPTGAMNENFRRLRVF
jgi:hypothetical protein